MEMQNMVSREAANEMQNMVSRDAAKSPTFGRQAKEMQNVVSRKGVFGRQGREVAKEQRTPMKFMIYNLG
jgi:hypothetical protein